MAFTKGIVKYLKFMTTLFAFYSDVCALDPDEMTLSIHGDDGLDQRYCVLCQV